MPIDYRIIPGSVTPIFRQIVDLVRLAIATDGAAAGEPLPSVRALAEILVINPNTVARAYQELAREGLIQTQPGKPAVIAAPRSVYSPAERDRRLAPALDAFIHQALALGIDSAGMIDALRDRLRELELAPSKGGRR